MCTRYLVTSLATVLALGACGGETGGDAAGGGGGVGAGGSDAGGLPTITACPGVPAPNAHISDFSVWDDGTWGAAGDLRGSQSFYQSDFSARFTGSVDTTAANPRLRLTATMPIGGYAGYVMWFGPCVDASAFSGIRFQVAGDLGGGTLIFEVQTNSNYPSSSTSPRGACVGEWGASCADNYAVVTVTGSPTTVSSTWAELTGGAPVSPADPHELVGLQWQANCPVSAGQPCLVNLTLDTVEFF